MKYLYSFLIFSLFASAQQFSDIPQSEEQFLGFDQKKVMPKDVFIDESTSLVWQNSTWLPKEKSKEKAMDICSSLTLGGYHWRLPTLHELQTLSLEHLKPSMKSGIIFGKNVGYLAADAPFWDRTAQFGFDYGSVQTLVLPKDSRKLYIRCISIVKP